MYSIHGSGRFTRVRRTELMKKLVVVFVLFFIFLLHAPLLSKGFEMKMNFGFSAGGKIEDMWTQTQTYYTFQPLSDQESKFDMDVSLDVIYMIHKNFGFSIGLGYFSKKINAGRMRFVPSPTSGYLEGFSYAPQFAADITPFYLSGIFSFSVLPKMQVYLWGGVSYYFGTLTCVNTDWIIEEREDWDEWNHLTYTFKSDIKQAGFHLGTGIEIKLPWNINVCFETLYRSAQFNDFNSTYYGAETDTARINHYAGPEKALGIKKANQKEWGSYFLYAERLLGIEEQGDFGYSLSEFDISGFSFRAGFKIRF